jgi:hypothetical protein
MFVGRARELAVLEKAYARDSFQMVVLYGRRRVGKTTLLTRFAQNKPTLFFTAQEQSDKDNLADFGRRIAEFFSLPSQLAFDGWDAAFDFLAEQARQRRFLLVFDEFPYAAQANPALPSKLQVAIDHKFAAGRLCLVLCGSNQGFMESSVLGHKSPLHGRRTLQVKLEPFGYLDARKMLGDVPYEDAFKYYCCIGGIPYYLSQVDTSAGFAENMRDLYFSPEGYLFGEPAMLLRQELREPAVYSSVLRAVAGGANRQKEIADRAGLQPGNLVRYLQTLRDLGILERAVPFGEDPETSRRGIYRIKDACYDYWYRFVAPTVADVERGAGALAARSVTDDALSDHLGHRFERVCLEWLTDRALEGALPVAATSVGSWWGTDPQARAQADIDVLAADVAGRRLLVGECKYRGSFNETEEMAKLLRKGSLVKGYTAAGYVFFSKNPMSAGSREKFAAMGNVTLVTLEEMYREDAGRA